jgi:hypothetical protein
LLTALSATSLFANQETKELIKTVRSRGLTKCDQLIMRENFIDNQKHPNWHYLCIWANSTK